MIAETQLQTASGQKDAESRRRRLPMFVLVAVLAALAHIGTLANGFVFDDRGAVLENPVVQGPLDLRTLLSTDYWGGRPPNWRVGIWRPLPVVTFWVDQRIGGGGPLVFHFTNLLFHLLGSVALTLAVYRQSGRLRLAAVVGSVFAVLAINSEAVAAIVSRADVMAAAFVFVAWASVAPFARPLTGRQLGAFAVALLAALMCKEAAIATAAGVVLASAALYLIDRRRSIVPVGQLIATTGAVLLAYVAIRQGLVAPVSLIKRDFLNNPLLNEPLVPRVWTGLSILALIVGHLAFPVRLIPDYSFAEITAIGTPVNASVAIGFVLLVALIASAWLLRRRDPIWTIGAVMLLVGWAALSNIPVPLPIVFAERLLYGISASAALLFAVAVDHLWDRRRVSAAIVLSVVVAGNFVRTVVRDRDWHDELRLFSRATADAPRSARAWNNLGAALMKDRQQTAALEAINRAIAIAPDWGPPHVLAGITLADLGRRNEAEASLRRASAIDPNDPQPVYNLAVLLAQWGRRGEAVTLLRQYVRTHPDAVREQNLLLTLSGL